jgi:hypothetical protein
MPNITPLPIPPTRQDPANFNDRADEFLSALESPFVPELNALRTEVLGAQTSANAGASTATNAANTATAAATAAQNYSNAEMWNASTNYALGVVAISPTDFQPYRRIVAGTSATDPASDATNWLSVYVGFVEQTSFTGSADIPTGTTAQRDVSPQAGFFRFNTTLGKFEGYTGSSWGSVGGGASGGGADEVFIENSQVITANYTITSGKSASSTGPITIEDGVTVQIPTGSRWVIL